MGFAKPLLWEKSRQGMLLMALKGEKGEQGSSCSCSKQTGKDITKGL